MHYIHKIIEELKFALISTDLPKSTVNSPAGANRTRL